MAELIFSGRLDIFSISENRLIRSSGKQADLSMLGADEYFSFSMTARNNTNYPFRWKNACISVDGGKPWHWASGQLQAGCETFFHVAYCNMKNCMTPGVHSAIWYLDGKAVHKDTFILTQNMKWDTVFPIPSAHEIETYQRHSTRRSPYIAAWLDIPQETRYTQYMIDFKVSHLPRGTYCCLGQWTMDHSELTSRYKQIRTEDGSAIAYAGFQRIADGRTVSIMSFWDTFYRDVSGKEFTVQAKRLFPQAVIDGGRFWGEGVGERSTAPFDWEAGHWYRMHLKCIAASAKTIVEQWVYDMETGANTLLCRYDTGLTNSSFKGPIAIFLENFLPKTAGQVRSMEVCNPKYYTTNTNRWHTINRAYVTAQDGLPHYEGSYDFGVSGHRLWMITSGVGGDWFHNGKGKKGTHFTLAND